MKSPQARADELFSRLIRARDQRCQNCGDTDRPQCAHIWSRSYRAVRWKMENAIQLCQRCHMSFTHHPAEWAAWCDDRMFSESGICHGYEQELVPWSYTDLRWRALNDPSEKPADALARLRRVAAEVGVKP